MLLYKKILLNVLVSGADQFKSVLRHFRGGLRGGHIKQNLKLHSGAAEGLFEAFESPDRDTSFQSATKQGFKIQKHLGRGCG